MHAYCCSPRKESALSLAAAHNMGQVTAGRALRGARLQQAEGGRAHEVQVLGGAVQRDAVPQAVHEQRTDLGARRQDDLVARGACLGTGSVFSLQIPHM